MNTTYKQPFLLNFRPLSYIFGKSGRDGKKRAFIFVFSRRKANWLLKIYSWYFFAAQCYLQLERKSPWSRRVRLFLFQVIQDRTVVSWPKNTFMLNDYGLFYFHFYREVIYQTMSCLRIFLRYKFSFLFFFLILLSPSVYENTFFFSFWHCTVYVVNLPCQEKEVEFLGAQIWSIGL